MSLDVPHQMVVGREDVRSKLAELDSGQLHAVLATVQDGRPYTSLVAFAAAPGGRGLLFATARKTRKYRNILASPFVSVIVDTRANSGKDYLGAESLTLEGVACSLRRGKRRDEMSRAFLRKHPALKSFVEDRATALVLIEPEQIVHVGRFQEVTVWRAEKSPLWPHRDRRPPGRQPQAAVKVPE